MSKMIIFTAPSGAGKTTIVTHLLEKFKELDFSISATSRPKRDHEVHGTHYYFYDNDAFKAAVEADEFLEWEEVYEGLYYGTLKSEVDRIFKSGKHIIFDIDVKGATNLKNAFPDAYAVFISPPSVRVLTERLINRKTESEASLKKRLTKVRKEMKFKNKFDRILVNDILEVALEEAEQIIEDFIY